MACHSGYLGEKHSSHLYPTQSNKLLPNSNVSLNATQQQSPQNGVRKGTADLKNHIHGSSLSNYMNSGSFKMHQTQKQFNRPHYTKAQSPDLYNKITNNKANGHQTKHKGVAVLGQVIGTGTTNATTTQNSHGYSGRVHNTRTDLK